MLVKFHHIVYNNFLYFLFMHEKQEFLHVNRVSVENALCGGYVLFLNCKISKQNIFSSHRYPLRPFLMTPFLRRDTEAKERYQAAHSRTRACIERAFGRWKRRLHVLHSEVYGFIVLRNWLHLLYHCYWLNCLNYYYYYYYYCYYYWYNNCYFLNIINIISVIIVFDVIIA